MLTRMSLVGVLLFSCIYAAIVESGPRDICTLFTATEIATWLGTDVIAGEPAAMGTGCQWFRKDEKSYVILQGVNAEFWIDPKQAPGYEAIQGIGKQAYSHPDPEGGWRAMALTSNAAASVVAIGATAKRAAAVALLRQPLERR